MPKIEGGQSSTLQKKRVGSHIREARKKKRWTQTQLGQKLGVGASTVCDWEKGRTYPGAENLRKLGPALGETVSFLIADRLGKKDSLEWLSAEIGVVLGYNRLSALLYLPEARLHREIDTLIGRYVVEEGRLPARRKSPR